MTSEKEKIPEIAVLDQPLEHAHLRVSYEHRRVQLS